MDYRSLQLMDDLVLEPRGSGGGGPSSAKSTSSIKKSSNSSSSSQGQNSKTNTSSNSCKPKTEKPQYKSLKVEMQTLQLSQEAEKQLYDTLKSICGPSFKLVDASEFENQNTNLVKQYWLERGNLVIKGAVDYSQSDNKKTEEQITRQFAASKLEAYSFHSVHCSEAIAHTEGNVGEALEVLFEKYYNVGKKENNEIDTNDCLQKRQEEKEALESIYGSFFNEKIKNRIWTIKLSLSYMIDKCEDKKKVQKPKLLQKDICRLYLQGKCHYGIKCRFIHQQPERVEKPKPQNEPYVTLEIRFPTDSTYPYEPPYLYLHKNDVKLTDLQCLKIVKLLYNESLQLCEYGESFLYSIISLLENENEVKSFLETSTDTFIDKNDPLFPKLISPNVNSGPKHHKKGSTYKRGEREVSEEDLFRNDEEIRNKFMKKQKNSQYLKMKDCRKQLPAWKMMSQILSTINQNQVTIISGETGCGKSTQVPQFILDEWLLNLSQENRSHAEIICTQPRRISAIGVAQRVAAERDELVGNTVGYQIRLENKMSSSTRLTFCTTGILLQRLSSDPLLKSVSHVIVDEVHERSAESDFLLMLLKKIIRKRKDLKVILMSATLKSDVFSSYFEKVPTLDIPGRTFPVQQIFLEDALELVDYVMEENSRFSRKIRGKWEALENDLVTSDVVSSSTLAPKCTILDENLTLPQLIKRYSDNSSSTHKTLYLMDHEKINIELIEKTIEFIVSGDHDYPRTGSILVFLPGISEILTLKDCLNCSQILSPKNRNFIIIPLHSSLSGEEQSLVFKKPKPGVRKIVLSTNIAETSVTIDDCVFVIDTGKMKETRFHSEQNMESLDTCWVSRANALQRRGRAGRVMSGICFHLYTSFRFKHHFESQPIPEILRVSLESVILRIKTLGNERETANVHQILGSMIDPPEQDNISNALGRLQDVGALDPENSLTPLGHHLASLPVDVRIGKLILYGVIFCCLDSALTIAACLSNRSPFVTPLDKKEEVNKKKKEFATANSDQLTTLKVYKKWLEISAHGYRAALNFANENFLSIKTLQTIADVKHQFLELLVSIGFVPINISRRNQGVDRVLELTGEDFNINNENSVLLQGLLCGALYPNIVKVLTPEKSFQVQTAGAVPRQPKPEELRFKTKDDGFVFIHPSSINYSVGHYLSPYIVYQEKIKTSRVFIRELSMVPMLPLILFSGYGINLELHNGTFIISLGDGWIMFALESHRVGQLLQYARVELVKLLQQKMEDPLLNLINYSQGKKLISTIVDVLVNKQL